MGQRQKLGNFKPKSGRARPAEPGLPDMNSIVFKGPQFVYKKDDRTGDAVVYCTRPVQFKAYVFITPDNPKGFKLLPEKDTEQIRKIMKRMDDWFTKWHSMER